MTETEQTRERPLIAYSRAELERRVIAAARALINARYGADYKLHEQRWKDALVMLYLAVTDLDTWTEQRAAQTEGAA